MSPFTRLPTNLRSTVLSLVLIATAASAAPASKPTVADQIALSRAVAAKLDGGGPLGDLVDPVEGVHVWWVPGSEEIEQTRLHARDKPADLFAKTEMTPYVQQHYASDTAAEIRYALAHLDVDPKHPDADSYQVDCTRSDVRAPRATLGHLTLERRGGVKLTFVTRAGKLYLSSIHQMTPCEV
jgi:hypothetical protein